MLIQAQFEIVFVKKIYHKDIVTETPYFDFLSIMNEFNHVCATLKSEKIEFKYWYYSSSHFGIEYFVENNKTTMEFEILAKEK